MSYIFSNTALPDRRADRALLDQRNQAGQRARRHTLPIEPLAELVQLPRHLSRHPVERRARVARRLGRLFEERGELGVLERRHFEPRTARMPPSPAGAALRAARRSIARISSMRSRASCTGGRSGSGKVAIVVRVFLAAHRERLARRRIPEPRLLHDRAAALEHVDLPLRSRTRAPFRDTGTS